MADPRLSLWRRLGTVEEEADESAYWMEMIIEGELLKQKQVEPSLNEANELVKIMARSRISASRRLRTKSAINEKQSGKNSNRQSEIGNRQ
jgi:hypothetical protein